MSQDNIAYIYSAKLLYELDKVPKYRGRVRIFSKYKSKFLLIDLYLKKFFSRPI
jgi:hypothetical protein